VYTSGSTGVPKGVLVPHRGLTNLAAAKVAGFDVRPDSRVLQFVSFGFGVSIADVYMTLTAGATLVLRGDAPLAGHELVDLVNRQRVTNLVLPASVLAALPADGAGHGRDGSSEPAGSDAELPTVRAIAVGGEACSAALVNRWAPGRRFVNAYGPSEVTIACAMAVCEEGIVGAPPIGRPIPGDRVYVLDERREPVPVGVPGELYAAGVGMTRGYLNRPELTAEVFVSDPFVPGELMYRTGDLARWRADGQLTLLGRRDDQVSVRGVRMELGEIEAALRAHHAIDDAVAVVDRHPVAGERVVAYVVGPGTSTADLPDAVELRRFLVRRLPEHFLPALVVPIDAVPRTSTGKVDRRRLPAPETVASPPSRPPSGVSEEIVAEIFEEVLGIAPGADDDFFALGGQSILAAGVTARIRDRFEIALPVRALFESPTVAGLAVQIEATIIAELELAND
jgi:amino acid adenylation domain-containing protein